VVRNPGPALGVAGAYNLGIAHARGRYVLLGSDDSLLAPGAIEEHLRGQSRATKPAYLCGIEYQYLAGVFFRDIITGTLHPRGDLAVQTFGGLLGFADIWQAAEMFEFTRWTITPEDVRERFPMLRRLASLPPSFRDIYAELNGEHTDLRWLCVRMGNHSVDRTELEAVGGVEVSLPGANSDQDLGLKLMEAGVEIRLVPSATSVLIEHRRNVRGFADHSGLRRLAERWPQTAVRHLDRYFAAGFGRSIPAYRADLRRSADSATWVTAGTET
jgi:hypothetical protein